MAHSKRNTSLAFFTSYERSLLKASWGSQSTRLTRDSYLPFASCHLCLLPSRDPVACASQGHVFCRECAISNLLTQRKEIKRLEKEYEKKRREEVDQGMWEDEEARQRAVEEFERVQMGLSVKLGSGRNIVGRANGKITVEEPINNGSRGTKRKFDLDEEEILDVAKEERERMKKSMLDDQKEASRRKLPSFWVASQTPSSNDSSELHQIPPTLKLNPLCPGSTEDAPHEYSLKSLVALSFTEGRDSKTGGIVRSCPSCRKALNNATKAMLATPCGHVVCKPCFEKFMTPDTRPNAHNPDAEPAVLRCYVCEADLIGEKAAGTEAKNRNTKSRDKVKPGIVEMSSDGTGFAGGGKNTAEKQGIAFQC
ncbi:MAG: hypothetical protein M1822_007512 [Bathelium mastoideum]|nr:MAG: hypothetical protein M1822_007512 [Bathelium mastoideum]